MHMRADLGGPADLDDTERLLSLAATADFPGAGSAKQRLALVRDMRAGGMDPAVLSMMGGAVRGMEDQMRNARDTHTPEACGMQMIPWWTFFGSLIRTTPMRKQLLCRQLTSTLEIIHDVDHETMRMFGQKVAWSGCITLRRGSTQPG